MVEQSKKRIVKNTAFLYIRMLLMMGINLFASRIILQALGVEDYGLYNVVGSIVIMFSIINGTLSAGTSRFLMFELGRKDFSKLKKTFGAAFLMHSVMAIVVFILAETIGLWFLNNKMIIPAERYFAANCLYQFSIVSCILSLTQVPYSAIIIAHERMSIYAWVGICEAFFKLCVIYVIFYMSLPDKLISYGLMIMCWSICLQIYYRLYCKKKFQEATVALVKDRNIYKSMFSFSMWDAIGAFCVHGNSQGINLLTNLFFGVVVNAARGIAFQVENALTQFSSNFMTAVNPQIVKSYAEGNIANLMTLVHEASKFSYFLLLLVSLPVFLETDYLLALWLVDVPEYTSIFLRYIIITRLIRAFNTPIIQAVHATGKIKWLNLVPGIASALLQIPLTYTLYKSGLPPYSTFWAILFVYVLCNYLELQALYRQIKFSKINFFFNVYLRGIGISLLAAIIPVLLLRLLEPSMMRFCITVLSSVLSVLLCVWCLGLNSENRKKILAGILSRIKR